MSAVNVFYTIRFDQDGNGVQRFEYNYVPESLGPSEHQCTQEQHENFEEYVLDSNRKIVRAPDRNLDGLRTKLKAHFRNLCQEKIIAGFESDALGSAHLYACAIEDQLNLMRKFSIGTDGKISCAKNGCWNRRVHTYPQIQRLTHEMEAHIEGQKERFAQLVEQIDLCTKRAELTRLAW